MKNTAKTAFTEGYSITKVIGGFDSVRVDAVNRNEGKFISKWVSKKYADKLSMDRFGKKIEDLRVYSF
jgi:hypothetical protein